MALRKLVTLVLVTYVLRRRKFKKTEGFIDHFSGEVTACGSVLSFITSL